MLRRACGFHADRAGPNKEPSISGGGTQGILDIMGATVRPETKKSVPGSLTIRMCSTDRTSEEAK